MLKTGQKILVWKNPKPGGTRLCRPVKLKFVKETPQVILAEKSQLEQCFASVPDLKVDIGEEEPIIIKFRAKDFMYTMVDGRVVNVFSNSSNSSCRLCKAPPSRLNDIDYLLSLKVEKEWQKYGICPMHGRIRAVDLVLAVAYRDFEGHRKNMVPTLAHRRRGWQRGRQISKLASIGLWD